MNEETNQEIRKYQFQIILLFGILISVFLSISILVLIKDLKEGKINQQDALEKINIRNKIASIIIALVSLYFFFDALAFPSVISFAISSILSAIMDGINSSNS